jgi:hypothetical protein
LISVGGMAQGGEWFRLSNQGHAFLRVYTFSLGCVIERFVGKVQELESGLETGVTGASPPTVTSMGGSFYLGGLVQGRRP